MENTKQQNKMGTMPVGRLMFNMSLPIVLSMMLQAVYNIVDSAFVSNMETDGELALNALTLAFPLQILMVAVGIGTGVGVNALLSKSLGQGDYHKSSVVAGNAVFLATIIYVAFLLFGIFGVDTYISSQTQNPSTIQMATDYLRVCCTLSFGIVFFSIFEKLLQATGHSTYSTIAQVAGALVNIVLDPIMIYGYLGLPALGVKGAAYATVIGQCVSLLLAVVFHFKVNTDIANGIQYLKPSLQTIKSIYAIGFPAIVAQALLSVMTYGLNIILGGISETLVTAYGLYYKIQQFVLFASFGLRDAITPIVSYSHGMGNKERINDGVKYGLLYTLILMVLGLLIVEVFAEPFSTLFGLTGDTKTYFVSAMRIISLSFVFAGTNIAFQGVFQALNGGLQSLIVSICRQLIFVLPIAYLFAQLAKGSLNLVWTIWLTFPIAEVVSVVVAILLAKYIYRKQVMPLA
jgi:putative MATE family efflux protein